MAFDDNPAVFMRAIWRKKIPKRALSDFLLFLLYDKILLRWLWLQRDLGDERGRGERKMGGLLSTPHILLNKSTRRSTDRQMINKNKSSNPPTMFHVLINSSYRIVLVSRKP